MPGRTSSIEVDVAVMPEGDELEGRLSWRNVKARYIVRGVKDPWLALSLAILAPSRKFRRLSIGIDPGPERSGLSAVADNILLWASKVSTSSITSKISWLRDWIPSISRTVYVGRGHYSARIAEMLRDLGISYRLVDEERTTKAPIRWYVLEKLKDRDVVASVMIAFLGMTYF